MIAKAMVDGDSHGYDLRNIDISLLSNSMGTRIFDLSSILETDEVPEVVKIAELLKNKSWS